MLFHITVIDKQGQERHFSFQMGGLEEGLDFLSGLVARGETLLKVSLSDNGKETDLPIRVFDGLRFSEFINELELEWKAILEAPSYDLWSSQDMIECNQVLLNRCEMRIVHLELLITQIEKLHQRASIHKNVDVSLSEKYQSILTSYCEQLIRAYTLRNQFLKRLPTN